MKRSLLATLVIFGLLRGSCSAENLTNCLQVLSLAPSEANQGRAVHLRGAVTCYVPSSQLCFVQDETAGVYVHPAHWPAELAVGEWVEVRGLTAAGRFSPIVDSATFERLGQKISVPAQPVSIEDLNTGRFDCRQVQIEGVIQKMTRGNGLWILDLRKGSSAASVLLFNAPGISNQLINARVRCTGVAGTYYAGERLTGFGLFAPSGGQLEVIDPPGDPFAAPLRSLGKLPWFSTEGAFDRRIRVQGVVTVSWSSNTFFIRDETGALRVQAAENAALQPGDLIEASGFIQDIVQNPHMTGAMVRKLGERPKPEPLAGTARQILALGPTGELVSLEGRVAAIENREERLWLITLESGQGFLRAFSREGLTNAQPGATMRLTGAWATAPESLRKEVAAGLWLAPPGDQVLLAPPPAASVTGTTGAKNHGKLWLGAGGLGLALGFTVSGLTFLRSRKSAAQLLAETETARQRLAELEREYQAQIEARERLGRDLHDHTIQSIYAIGLNLDDCTHLLRQDPEKVEARLRTALMEVNAVISELRNVILGLETNAIQPREFRTALKSLALALGHEKSNKIRLDIDQGALEGLTPVQATELVHIAREAMSNSIRHGAAQTTTFALALVPEGIRFMVQDDGRGFETSSQPRHGFGLRNMAKRAEALGAKFTVSSRPGHGTRITLDIPKQKQHPTVNESRTRIDS